MKIIQRFSNPLEEMATIGMNFDLKVKVTVNPDPSRRDDPNFKVISPIKQNSKIIRLSFLDNKIIRHRDKLPPLEMTNKLNSNIQKFLKLPWVNNRNVTNWDAAKYYWNLECGFIDGGIEDYVTGIYDEDNETNPSYVPSTQKIPEYWK